MRTERKKRKIVTMPDGSESAKHEPYTLMGNPRLNLEKSLQAISLLLCTLTDPFGDAKDLDYRIAIGMSGALDRLADLSQGLFSHDEMVEHGGRPFYERMPNK